jgi:hypothetical protein
MSQAGTGATVARPGTWRGAARPERPPDASIIGNGGSCRISRHRKGLRVMLGAMSCCCLRRGRGPHVRGDASSARSRLPARRGARRCAGGAGRVPRPLGDPRPLRPRGHPRARSGGERDRPHHRRHADDAVHRRGPDPGVGAGIDQGHLPPAVGGASRLPALAAHPGGTASGSRARAGGRRADRHPGAVGPPRTGQHLSLRTRHRRAPRHAGRQRQQGLRRRHAHRAGRAARPGATVARPGAVASRSSSSPPGSPPSPTAIRAAFSVPGCSP